MFLRTLRRAADFRGFAPVSIDSIGRQGRAGSQRRNRGEQLAAVPDRGHSEGDQIVSCKLRQHIGVDIVVVKRLVVALKAQAPEPAFNVHRRRPHSGSGHPHVTPMVWLTH